MRDVSEVSEVPSIAMRTAAAAETHPPRPGRSILRHGGHSICASGGGGSCSSTADAASASAASSSVRGGLGARSSSPSVTPTTLPRGERRSAPPAAMATKSTSEGEKMSSRVRMSLDCCCALAQMVRRVTEVTSMRLLSCLPVLPSGPVMERKDRGFWWLSEPVAVVEARCRALRK